jgi:hypothetical protein
VHRELTVARVRGSEEEDYVEVLFLESARIYLLERTRRALSRTQDGRPDGARALTLPSYGVPSNMKPV